MNPRTGRGSLLLLLALVLFGAGFALGRWALPGTPAGDGGTVAADAERPAAQVWTCSMHPQIRMPQPGDCPICGMSLTPAADAAAGGSAVVLSEAAQRVASIEVEAVTRRPLAHEVATVGRIVFAEPNVANVASRVSGRVERIYADYTGVDVAEGDHLVDLYSPELVVAQEEFLLSLRATDAGGEARARPDERDRERYELSREKLRLLGLTEVQIRELEETRKPQIVLTVHTPIGGTVVAKNVREQAYVSTGDPLYDIADLSRVWLLADVYEFELPWIVRGQVASVAVEALPGETFEGLVAFIDPRVDEMSRTVKVRVNLDNERRLLKPGMFAHVTIRAPLGPDGKRTSSLFAGMFSCPMHPEVVAEAEGSCPICGMALVREPGEPRPSEEPRAPPPFTCPMHPEVISAEPGRCPECNMFLERAPAEPDGADGAALLAVPATAVLDSGARRIVWVEREPGRYEAAEVVLGPRAGDRYPVLGGLAEGDRVVVRGNFLLDSQSQIEGKPSLLFPRGLEAGP